MNKRSKLMAELFRRELNTYRDLSSGPARVDSLERIAREYSWYEGKDRTRFLSACGIKVYPCLVKGGLMPDGVQGYHLQVNFMEKTQLERFSDAREMLQRLVKELEKEYKS